jgi:hypothetical protein
MARIAFWCPKRQNQPMGRHPVEEQTPDLFPTDWGSGPLSNQVGGAKARRPRRVALPKDLSTAVKYLNNGDLDRLLRAATEEARRRGRLPAAPETPPKIDPGSGDSSSKQALPTGRPIRQPPARTATTPLTRGQVNAVRAAFKAGVTPPRVARQFGLSQSQIRKALSSDEPI